MLDLEGRVSRCEWQVEEKNRYMGNSVAVLDQVHLEVQPSLPAIWGGTQAGGVT